VRPSLGLPFVEHVPRFRLKRKEENDDYQAKLNCDITNDMNCAFLQRTKNNRLLLKFLNHLKVTLKYPSILHELYFFTDDAKK
jgi:hypothetical protein